MGQGSSSGEALEDTKRICRAKKPQEERGGPRRNHCSPASQGAALSSGPQASLCPPLAYPTQQHCSGHPVGEGKRICCEGRVERASKAMRGRGEGGSCGASPAHLKCLPRTDCLCCWCHQSSAPAQPWQPQSLPSPLASPSCAASDQAPGTKCTPRCSEAPAAFPSQPSSWPLPQLCQALPCQLSTSQGGREGTAPAEHCTGAQNRDSCAEQRQQSAGQR